MHQYNLPLYFSILPYINPSTYALWIPCIFITPLFSFPSRHVLKHHHISNNHIPDHGSNKLSSKTLNPQEFQKHTTVFSQDHWSLAWTLKAYKTTPLIPIITAGNWFTLQSSQPWPNSLNSNTISYSQINFQKYSFIIKTNPNQAIRNDVLSTSDYLHSIRTRDHRTRNHLTPQKPQCTSLLYSLPEVFIPHLKSSIQSVLNSLKQIDAPSFFATQLFHATPRMVSINNSLLFFSHFLPSISASYFFCKTIPTIPANTPYIPQTFVTSIFLHTAIPTYPIKNLFSYFFHLAISVSARVQWGRKCSED